MESSQKPRDGSGSRSASGSQLASLLSSIGSKLLPALITAGSLLGFVAFAGAVIVWTRFEAVKVPPDQAVNAVRREELVSVGASLLLIFGFFGVIALVATYLVDRRGRATPGMARWLLCLLAVEGVVAIVLTEGLSALDTVVLASAVVLLCMAGVLVTFVDLLTSPRDDFAEEDKALLAPLNPHHPFLWSDGEPWIPAAELAKMLAALAVLVAVGLVLVLAGPALLPALLLVLPVAAAIAFLFVVGRPVVADFRRHLHAEDIGDGSILPGRPRRRPARLYLLAPGVALLAVLLGLMVAIPALVLGQWWLATSLGSAVLLTSGLWRIAALPRHGFMWFGLAVFLSVPLFGTLSLMARNIAHPQVQPMALIRKTDGPYEAIQGLYVAEGDDRVYFADLATEGCSDTVTPNSGRLLWVPKSEVVALSIGPAEDLESAARSALEMSYALTPGVETPAGDQASLTVAERSAKAAAKPSLAEHDRRLEGAGPAVRPDFGAGLNLSPEEVSPGQVVTLRMSAPNKGVEGFGETRNGRTLRVGGARANIVKEPTSEARRAEYVETKSGQVLNLAKHEPFVERSDGEFVPLEEEPRRAAKGRYVKLIDKAVLSVEGVSGANGAFYLPLEEGAWPATLAGDPEVELRGVEEAGSLELRPRPLTQAWYESKIKFRVPENAASGPVTVECNQLEGQPLLRISKPPVARIGASLKVGTDRIVFDSRRSVGAGSAIERRRWVVDGLPVGHGKRLALPLPARYAPYRVRLYATSSDGETDLAEVSVLRLPARAVERGHGSGEHHASHAAWSRRIRHALERTARIEHPVEVDVDGFADGKGGARRDASLSLRRAELARQMLLSLGSGGASASTALDGIAAVQPTVPVKVRAFGHSCPVAGDAGGDDRVELFLLEDGTKVTSPSGCTARRTRRAEWLPPR